MFDSFDYKNIKRLKLKKYSFLLFAIFLSGCSLWTNFTTYFNLYYNTKDLFADAESQIKEQKRDLFATTDLVIPGGANTNLNKVVEKCSRILQFASKSDYVDDALLIIGKCFYYQKNYLKAIRKFQELLATQPESDLILETELWIGKCQMKLREERNGIATLRSVRTKAIEEDESGIIKESYVEEIVYYIAQENNQTALTLLNEFLEVSDDDVVNAEILYQAGKLYVIENEIDNAINVFARVFDYSPSYDIEQDANIQLAMALREGGESEKSLKIFESMRKQDKYSQAFDIIDLETGITLYESGKVEEAIEKLTLVDTTYTNLTTSGTARYMIGEIYENHYNNYDSASSYYARASSSPITDEYKPLALEKTKLFRKYAALRTSIDVNEKKLFYLNNPEEFEKDSLAYVLDSLSYIADSLKNVDVSHLFKLPTDIMPGDTTVTDSTKIDSLKTDSTLTQNPVVDYTKIPPPVINRGDDRKQGEETVTTSTTHDPDKPKLIRPLKPNIPEDSVKTLIAKDQLELGNLFLTELHRSDSAYTLYKKNLDEYDSTQYYASTLYALGTYYLTLNNRITADSLFSLIYDNYKNESIVNAAANQLNRPLIDLDYDPAKQLYADAEAILSDSSFTESIDKFINIYNNYPASTFAPKALYASGWIWENHLFKPDSAAILYDTLLVKYPASVYAGVIKPKLTFFKQEKERIKKEIEDSLRLIQQLIADSIRVDSLNKITPLQIDEEKSDSLNYTNPDVIEELQEESFDPKNEGKKEEESGDDGEEKNYSVMILIKDFYNAPVITDKFGSKYRWFNPS